MDASRDLWEYVLSMGLLEAVIIGMAIFIIGYFVGYCIAYYGEN
jgi:ABC-type dipeptide/oligopeptide/nickel transport system permease subunit